MVLGHQWSLLRYFLRAGCHSCCLLWRNSDVAGRTYGICYCACCIGAALVKQTPGSWCTQDADEVVVIRRFHVSDGSLNSDLLHSRWWGKLSVISAALLVALFTISAVSVDRLKGHVTWLADTARDGRKAGTPGARAAAD